MSNKDIRWIQRFSNYKKALIQLTKFIDKGDLNELEEQGLIQAFEYTHELAWNTLKDFITHRGNSEIYGSKDATREAFKLGVISDGDTWMDMISNRNLTTHTYNESTAKEIAGAIKDRYFHEFCLLRDSLQALAGKE